MNFGAGGGVTFFGTGAWAKNDSDHFYFNVSTKRLLLNYTMMIRNFRENSLFVHSVINPLVWPGRCRTLVMSRTTTWLY